jgi:HK97 family phage major capsid protein/HK97 family phage prohead protease
MHRAYSLFSIKSVDSEQRIIEGVASTPELDRQGDSMDSAGAKFSLPLPLLLQHQKDKPIGHVLSARVTSTGIHIKAQIASGVLPFIDEAWALIKAGLIRGLSIGWRPLASPVVKDGAIRYTAWEWLELSAVTIPANQSATILSVKSADTAAASGTPRSSSILPGASGSRRDTSMNTSEDLTTKKNELQIKSTRLDELETADDANGGLDADETAERDTLIKEVQTLTAKVSRLSTLEAAQMAQGQTLTFPAHTPDSAKPPTRTKIEFKNVDLPKGTLFTRYAMAVAAGKGSYSDTIAYAKRWDPQTPQVSAYVKSAWGQKAVEGTSVVASPGWGGELVNPSTIQTEFVELVRAETILGKVPGFRMTPFNIPIITQTGGTTFEWVGEAAEKPVSEMAFTRTTLPYHKVAGIVVLTEELVRLSTPNAEETARRDLVEQCARFLDEQFIRVAVSAGADNPASITNGVNAPNASGTTLAALKADLNTALSTLSAAGITLSGLVIVTTSEVALRLSLMTTTLGTTPSGFNMTPSGGSVLGYPVIVSDSVDADTLVIFKPSEIFLADDGRVTLDASNQATLNMGPGSATPDFNLWQRNCVGIRAERWITWLKRRPTVVAIIDTIAYVPGT